LYLENGESIKQGRWWRTFGSVGRDVGLDSGVGGVLRELDADDAWDAL
jgi:hypothetical protein